MSNNSDGEAGKSLEQQQYENARSAYKQNLDFARAAHADARIGQEPHLRQIDLFSMAAFKTPVLVAAGGIAAVLGFYSANYATLSLDPVNLKIFNDILKWLFLSLVFGMVAPCSAYWAQMFYYAASTPAKTDFNHPFVYWNEEKQESRIRWGNMFRWVAIFLVASAIASIIYGGWLFLSLVR